MSPYQQILNQINEAAATSGHAPPTLIAVSKTKSVDEIVDVYRQDHRAFGENYVQELVQKSEELHRRGITDVQFHFIGGLQRNKVRQLLPHAQFIHSVDSIRLLEEIDEQARTAQWNGGILIQVNIDGESSKGGFTPEDLGPLTGWVDRKRPFVRLSGLMCIPDPAKDAAAAFTRLRHLRDQYGTKLGTGLSMGMSSDFEVAIREGATHLRIGSAIFGSR